MSLTFAIRNIRAKFMFKADPLIGRDVLLDLVFLKVLLITGFFLVIYLKLILFSARFSTKNVFIAAMRSLTLELAKPRRSNSCIYATNRSSTALGSMPNNSSHPSETPAYFLKSRKHFA